MTQLPRAQLTQSLQVPGLAVTPPVSAGVQQANDILRSVGIIGGVAAQIGNTARHIANEREAEQAEIDQALRGQASQDIGRQLPEFEAKVASGELDHLFADLGEGETINGRAEAFLLDRIGEDAPQAYREEVLKFVPRMTQGLVDRNQQIINESKAVVGSTMLEATHTATSTEDLSNLANAYANATGVSPERARLDVINQMANTASRTGDPAQMALLEQFGGEAAPSTVAITRDRVNAKQREASNQARIEESRLVTGFATQAINGGNLDTALADFDQLVSESPNAEPAAVSNARAAIQEAIKNRSQEAFLSEASNLDRSQTNPSLYQQAIQGIAKKHGVPIDTANAINNQRLIDQAGELANGGDVEGVQALSALVTRPSSQERELFSDAARQAQTRRTQIEARHAAATFKRNKDEARREIVGTAVAAVAPGSTLKRNLPTTDITVEINGQEVTFQASKIREEAHRQFLSNADRDFIAEMIGEQDGSLTGQAAYDAAVEKAGGAGPLNAALLKNRIAMLDETDMPDPAIQSLFANSRARHIPAGSTADDLGPSIAFEGELFDQLDRMQLAKSHMDADTYNRFTIAKALTTSGIAPSIGDGLIMAAHPPIDTDTRYTATDADFAERTDDLIDNMGVTVEPGRVRNSVLRTANTLIDHGIDRENALKTASEMFQRDNIVVDGSPVEFNGVGAAPSSVNGLFGVLKDYIEKTQPEKFAELAEGKDSITLYRDPRSGQTVIHAASGLGGPLMVLSDEQFKVLANDYGATATEIADFEADIEAMNRAQRRRNGDVTLSDVGSAIMTSFTESLKLKTDSQIDQVLDDQLFGDSGANYATRPPRPPSESDDPVVRDISAFMRMRATQGFINKTETGSENQSLINK